MTTLEFYGADPGQPGVACADLIYTMAHEKVTGTEISGANPENLGFHVFVSDVTQPSPMQET